MKIILIDNYDSFTYNLKQYLEIAGAEVSVVLNDEISFTEAETLHSDGIIISPGPGTPKNPDDVGISSEIISKINPKIPVLGICIGHQIIGHLFGAEIIRTDPVHGEISGIKKHHPTPLFEGIPNSFSAMRYHSLIINPKKFPENLQITAKTEDGIIMAIEHKNRPLYGVQFHPESIGTQNGQTIISNFLKICQR